VETYLAGPGHDHFVGAVTEVHVGDGARLEHVRATENLQTGHHIASLAVRQARGSSYRSRVVTLGGALSRLDLRVQLDGEGAEVALRGATIGGGQDVVDHHTFVDHRRPNCSSRASYRAIVDGRANAVLDAITVVRPGAQQTSAHQELRSLALSDDASVNAKPHLEIEADDVSCTHGATVGAIDDEQLFYLRSRGIPEPRARAMLTYAFVRSAIDEIEHGPVRARLARAALERLPHGRALGEVAA
jgi:Fe-S cluster assembly protein SufD